jgi:hypothetical protein
MCGKARFSPEWGEEMDVEKTQMAAETCQGLLPKYQEY